MLSITSLEHIPIIFQDDRFFAVNKPSGIHSVALRKRTNPSVAEILLQNYPALAEVAASRLDAGLVNRLDLETSGILLGAKTSEDWTMLRDLLMKGKIEKIYLAVLEGKLIEDQQIEGYIGSENRGAKKMKFSLKPKKRFLSSETLFSPVKFLSEYDATLVRAVAATARRHQIRVHAAKFGHCLLGDKLYGSKRDFPEGIDKRKFYLHAEKVAFKVPGDQEKITIWSAGAAIVDGNAN